MCTPRRPYAKSKPLPRQRRRPPSAGDEAHVQRGQLPAASLAHEHVRGAKHFRNRRTAERAPCLWRPTTTAVSPGIVDEDGTLIGRITLDGVTRGAFQLKSELTKASFSEGD